MNTNSVVVGIFVKLTIIYVLFLGVFEFGW